MYERVYLAALDCHNYEVRDACLDAIVLKFPDSNRAKVLNGLLIEAEGEYKEANELYDEVLKADPVNKLAWKRKVCIQKQMGDVNAAIGSLNKFLKVFCSDEQVTALV